MPVTRSIDVLRMPSLRPSTSTSPTRRRGAVISQSLPGERDHAARGYDDGHGQHSESASEAAGERNEVSDHRGREGAEHLGDEGAHALGLAHVLSAHHAVHEHLTAGNADLLSAKGANHQNY